MIGSMRPGAMCDRCGNTPPFPGFPQGVFGLCRPDPDEQEAREGPYGIWTSLLAGSFRGPVWDRA